MAREVLLTKGLVAQVDEEDFLFISQWSWYSHRARNGRFYAVRHSTMVETGSRPRTTILMHKVILARMGHSGMPDHKNNDGLDNRRENLRPSNHSLNGANRGMQPSNKTGYKGVFQLPDGSYKAMIDGQYIGKFWCPIQAAIAYNIEATKLYGEYALLNAIPEVSHR